MIKANKRKISKTKTKTNKINFMMFSSFKLVQKYASFKHKEHMTP